ncbi:endospore germination permease [Tissierella sp. MB52-C2]|uniref:GerAB/ArcD/ProY family transporter n=1 Tax=Tissierella sp. MB52-C2 TaxID=3070999 RepID=UPI00280ABDE7|nr:endospore germination permease [Tissierella sp. MB52-C2]WMM25515.1 endospore germination permease [Tissierella sp. MB52-C2]
MKIDKGKISGIQFMFTVACFIQSSSLLTSFFTSITNQDSWIIVIMGFIVSIIPLLIYGYIMKTFPDENLIEINDIVFGGIIGKIFSVLYLWFFMTLSSLNIRDLGDFVQRTTMTKTPPIIVISIFVLLCAWTVRNGIEVVTRYSMFFTLIAILIVISTSLLTINQMNIDNFLPIFDQPKMVYIQGTHIISTIPFGEIVVFLMINSNLEIEPKKRRKYFIYGFIIGGLTLLTIVLRDTAVLGNTMKIFSLPSFETLRLISIHSTLSRVEVLFAVSLIILMFFKICILYYVTVMSVAYIFKLKSFKSLVASIGVISIIYSFNIYPTVIEHMNSASKTAPFQWLLYETILPLITMIVIKIRKLPKLKKGMIS